MNYKKILWFLFWTTLAAIDINRIYQHPKDLIGVFNILAMLGSLTAAIHPEWRYDIKKFLFS